MHLVTHLDWTFSESPADLAGHASGLAHRPLVGRHVGATHTDLAVSRLAPGGSVQRHVDAFEQAFYVLAGQPVLELGERRLLLETGDYALAPIGVPHAWANAGPEEARWLSVSTPMRTAPEEQRRDTFFVEPLAGPAEPVRPAFGDPRSRWVGHYLGTPPQAEALALGDPARGRRPAGMDTALLAYSGISVRMLVDRVFGAELLTMFTVDYEPNGAAQVHDHPFEETYFFLHGEIEAVLDGREYTIRAGDVVFAGVGSTHGFFNTGSGRVRWIETQAPLPTPTEAFRFQSQWDYLQKKLSGH